MEKQLEKAIILIEEMGREGLVVSIAYGPNRDLGLSYSVDILNTRKEECLRQPIFAESFEQAAAIGWIEAYNKGWFHQHLSQVSIDTIKEMCGIKP